MKRRPVKPMFSLKRRFAQVGAAVPDVGMTNTHAWATLGELLGQSMPLPWFSLMFANYGGRGGAFNARALPRRPPHSRAPVPVPQARLGAPPLLFERRVS